MVDPNRALFEAVVRLLRPVLDDLVFVGGCTTGLFLTDPAASGIRPTKDVDAIVDVTSYAKYASLAERLRALGLVEDTTPGAPLCRWRRAEMIVDVMPTDASRVRVQQSMVPRGDSRPPRCTRSPAKPCGSSHRRCSSPRNSKHFTVVAPMTSSRVTISRTLSRSWMAARQSPPRLRPPTARFVPTSPPRSARFSTTRTSSRRCLGSCCPTLAARLGDACWKSVFGHSADERRSNSAGGLPAAASPIAFREQWVTHLAYGPPEGSFGF